MQTNSVTIRIKRATHQNLKVLAHNRKQDMQSILDEAVESLRRQTFLNGLSEDFATLRADPVAWQEEIDERKLWDQTIADDLDGEGS